MPSSDRVRAQAVSAHHLVMSKLVHGLLPWAAWLLFTVAGAALRLAFARWALLTVPMTLACGGALAALTLHLHGNRLTLVGKTIGPATAVAGSVIAAVWLAAGFSVPLLLAYGFLGILFCVGWDVWIHEAAAHDITRAFGAASEAVLGAPARLAVTRPAKDPAAPPSRSRARRARSGPASVTGRVMMPPEASVREAAERAEGLEENLGYPPGSVTVAKSPDGPWGDFTASDPRLLDRTRAWPGPSAPGDSVAVPFRLGERQDGKAFRAALVPVFNTRTSGMTGSGKTMSWLWNRAAEGVTRPDYAMFGIDVTKMWQFLGPVREGLHAAAVTPESALRLMAAFERARVARLGYMAAQHMTEWREGCGLTYMDIALEELGEILKALADASKAGSGAPFDLGDWFTNVRAGRSTGMSWNASNQTGKHTQFPTDVRGQFHPVTFGVEGAGEAKLALSDNQLEAGCRPQLWGTKSPGRAVADFPTMEPGGLSMPVRFYDWGGDGSLIAAYMRGWPAAGRPLDDVTGEAMEAEPAQPASYALPEEGGRLAGPGRPRPANVRYLPGAEPPAPKQDEKARERELAVMAQFAAWEKAGKVTFTSLDLQATGIAARLGVSRPWLYGAVDTAVARGRLELVTDKPKKVWRILPERARRAEEE